MLRFLALLLLFANLLFFAWTQGVLDPVVPFKSIGDREPERLKEQKWPERLKLLPPAAASLPSTGGVASAPALAASGAPLACLEAGPFGAGELAAAEAALAGTLPAGRWVDVKADKGGAYIIHMGRFANREALLSKQAELARIKVANEELRGGELAPGLALGRFDGRAAAERALEALGKRGIRSARIAVLGAPTAGHLLRVEDADAALAEKLGALKAAALGSGFQPCAAATAAR